VRFEQVVRITPADVGRRVSVRQRLEDPGPGATDTVGHLLEWRDDVLRIKRKDGSVATVPAGDLLAGKVIPDQPPRRAR
jgi:hypothetical protein